MTANLWQLFLSFMQVGMFSIGGGYAAMPFIRSQVVSVHGWLTMSEFTDLVTIAEMTPGPIAVNAATFVGNRLAGFTGAIVATMGCILPSCLIVSLLAYLYRKYRQMGEEICQALDQARSGEKAFSDAQEASTARESAANAASPWTCPACGGNNQGKFCEYCGSPRP